MQCFSSWVRALPGPPPALPLQPLWGPPLWTPPSPTSQVSAVFLETMRPEPLPYGAGWQQELPGGAALHPQPGSPHPQPRCADQTPWTTQHPNSPAPECIREGPQAATWSRPCTGGKGADTMALPAGGAWPPETPLHSPPNPLVPTPYRARGQLEWCHPNAPAPSKD